MIMWSIASVYEDGHGCVHGPRLGQFGREQHGEAGTGAHTGRAVARQLHQLVPHVMPCTHTTPETR